MFSVRMLIVMFIAIVSLAFLETAAIAGVVRVKTLEIPTMLERAQYYSRRRSDPCLYYHPTIGYYNGCTPEGRATTRRFQRGFYRGYPRGGYDPCLHYHPSRGYYRVC